MPSPASIRIRQTLHKEAAPSALPIAEQRAAWLEFARTQPLPASVQAIEQTVAGVACLRILPTKAVSDALVVYLHGGGLVDGDPITHRAFAAQVAMATGYPILLVGYRLAPEHPFPAAIDDIMTVLQALLPEPAGPSLQRIALGGDSSGAGLALTAAQRRRDEGLRAPACLFSISGVFDLTLSAPSMTECAAVDPCLTVDALKGWLPLLGPAPDLRHPWLSPLFGEFHDLPPCLFQVGEHEIWRDDSTRAAARHSEAGNNTTLRVWDSMWHVWPMYPELPEAGEAIEELAAFLEPHLRIEPLET